MSTQNCTSVVGVYAKGPKGDKGDIGDITPEAEVVRAAIQVAQTATATALIEAQKAAVTAINLEEHLTDLYQRAEDGAATSLAQSAIAVTKANEASASADTAQTHAHEAIASAEIANTQAGIATSQAGVATTKAGEASASEQAAQTYWQNIEDQVTVPLLQMATNLITTQTLVVNYQAFQ